MSINDMVKKETSSHSLLMFPSKIHSKYSNDIPIIPVVKKKVFYKIHKVKDTLCKNAFFFLIYIYSRQWKYHFHKTEELFRM